MGIYDTFIDGDLGVQIKCTNDGDSMLTYNVGDAIEFPDCVLIGYCAAVVIKDNTVVMVTDKLKDKWGVSLDCGDIIGELNPVAIAVEKATNELKINRRKRIRETFITYLIPLLIFFTVIVLGILFGGFH